MHHSTRMLLVLSLAAGGVVSTGAQAPRRVTLKSALVALAAEFSDLNSARELSDGRVLLTDRLEDHLVVADFRKNSVMPLGRIGDGPGEFPMVIPVIAVGRDSLLMANSLAHRWTLIAGTSLTTVPSTSKLAAITTGATGSSTGSVLFSRGATRTSAAMQGDSSYVVLLAGHPLREDTIARTWQPPTRITSAAEAEKGITISPYSVYESAFMMEDGWVAVVRVNPYRVDWRAPDGRWTRGAPIPEPALPFDAKERAAMAARRASASPSGQRVQAPGVGYGTLPPITIGEWPGNIPPFTSLTSFRAKFAPDGKLLILRTVTTADPDPRYDVINHQGVREYQLTLRAHQSILGFGATSVYVTTTDDDGIERISKHPWP